MASRAFGVVVVLFLAVGGTRADPAPGGTFLEVADGMRVRQAGRPEVYLVDRGVLRHFTERAYERLYPDFRGVCIVLSIPRHLVTEPLGAGTRLVRAPHDPHVWLIDNGQVRRHVASPEAFAHYGFSWALVRTVPPEEIDYLPEGPRLG